MAVYVVVICGMIWDHPGMLRLVGLFCALTSLYVAERDRMDIMFGGKEKCFGGQLKQKVSDSLFPFRAGHSASGQEGWLSVGWG